MFRQKHVSYEDGWHFKILKFQ